MRIFNCIYLKTAYKKNDALMNENAGDFATFE